MKLLIEEIQDFEVITEAAQDGKKTHYIQGIFMQAEKPNRNGRKYPKSIMENEVQRFIEDAVKKNRAVGTLGHEATPKVSEDKVSHLITQLKMEGNDVYGKAKVLNTQHGKELQALIEGGVSFGVSSRAVGSLKMINGINEVQNDFKISCVDAVLNPSAIDAWVNAVCEGTEWIYEESTGMWMAMEASKKAINTMTAKQVEANKIQLFEQFMLRMAVEK